MADAPQVSGEVEELFSALKADATGYWEAAHAYERWRWLARLATGPYPGRTHRRLAREILKKRRQEREDLRANAFKVMSRNTAVEILKNGKDACTLKEWNDAHYVMEISETIRRRKVGSMPYVLAGAITPKATVRQNIEEIWQLHRQGEWLEIPSAERARMVQILRMTARTNSPANVKLRQIARTILAENNIPLTPPPKYEPERKERDDKTTDRLIAAFHGMVAIQMNVLRDKMERSRWGSVGTTEKKPAQLEAALRLVQMGEAVLIKDAVEKPKRGKIPEGENERTPRRIVIISQAESTHTAPEEMI